MSKANQTRDMQALQFAVQSVTSAKCPWSVGAFTAVGTSGTARTATTNDARAATLNDLQGQVVISNTNATWASGTPIWAVVLKNTAGANSVLTLDDWRTFANPPVGGQAAAATANFMVFPAPPPFMYVGLTDSLAAVSGTETGTQPGGTEWVTGTAPGMQRQAATTFTHTAGAATGTLGLTFTYTGSTSVTLGRSFVSNSALANDNAGAATAGNFGFFWDQLNGATGYQVAANGDTLQVVYTITYAVVP